MGYTLTTPPAAEPVTVLEAMRQIRLDTSNLQPPPSVLTVALISPAEAGNVDNGVHRWRATFVTADGETDGGDISSPVTVVDKTANGKVRITAIPVGASGVTSRKLYRTIAGGSTYFLLATIADNTTTVYTDNIADSGLGAGIPSINATVDPQISTFISAARHQAERYTSAGFVSQVWTLTLDGFPSDGSAIPLPRGPVISLDAITYLDEDGEEVTIEDDPEADPPETELSDLAVLDQSTLSANVSLVDGAEWPDTASQKGAVSIVFTVGYVTTAANTPADIKAAILLRVADLYRNREAQQGESLTENKTVCALLDPHVRTAVA